MPNGNDQQLHTSKLWYKKFAGLVFLFFLVKGLLWLSIPVLIALFVTQS